MSKKNKILFFVLKQGIRISALFYGLLYSAKVVSGLHFGDEMALLAFCLLLSLIDLGLRPLLKILCLPLDILTFGMTRKLIYTLLITASLVAGFFYLPELKLSTSSLAQNIQVALVVWIYTLTILTVIR